MLKHLHLENFKVWKELDIQFGQVTGLFGTNSSGKSSILQFLLLLKQTKDATDRGLVLDFGDSQQLVNLGSYKDIIHNHQESLPLSWKIDWLLGFSKLYKAYIKENPLIKTEVSISLESNQIQLDYLSCNYKDRHAYIKRLDVDRFLLILDEDRGELEIDDVTLTKTHIFPEDLDCFPYIDDIVTIINSFENGYERLMDRIYYLGPLREHPKREYQWSGSSPSTVGNRGEYTVNAILAATIRKETRNLVDNQPKPFQEIIAYWLKELGLIHDFFVKEIADNSNLYQAFVKTTQDSPAVFLTNVGFGVSQVLPILVLLYYVPEGSTILMEQPEIHLHPSVQSGLADVILEVSKQRQLQVIVESHSEHLLRRFQRRIAEEKYSVNDLKLYFCEIDNGESKLSDLQINEFGDIENYPENFFGDEMAEIAATRKAVLKRKMKMVAASDK